MRTGKKVFTDAVQSEMATQRVESSKRELKGKDEFGTTGRRRHLCRGMRILNQ